MTELQTWLDRATRGLALDPARRVRAEYGSAHADALAAGEADPVANWGDPDAAGRLLRRVHLTAREERWLQGLTSPPERMLAETRRAARWFLWLLPALLAVQAATLQALFGLAWPAASALAALLLGAYGLFLRFDLRALAAPRPDAQVRAGELIRGMAALGAIMAGLLLFPWRVPPAPATAGVLILVTMLALTLGLWAAAVGRKARHGHRDTLEGCR